MQTKFTIPKKHYLGLDNRRGLEAPLGFITPWGEDAAAKKRMATVDAWSSRSKTDPAILDNIPMIGFKMTSNIRSSSYGGVDKWNIVDPRGFVLEITSHIWL